MRIYFSIILCAVLIAFFAGTSLAIEKNKAGTGQKHSAEIDSQKKPSPPPAQKNANKTQSSQRQGGKGYDSFVDKNKDGIDDRARKSTKKAGDQPSSSDSKKSPKSQP
jgi:hypothetical protein